MQMTKKMFILKEYYFTMNVSDDNKKRIAQSEKPIEKYHQLCSSSLLSGAL